MTTVFRLSQPLKAALSMVVTLSGTVTEERALQPKNADAPIFLTDSTSVNEVIPDHPSNAASSIFSVVSGITSMGREAH